MPPDSPPPPTAWEAAYLRFQTPAEELRKFRRRLVALGAGDWPRDAEIVEIFCGRGNGLRALHSLGFGNVEGVDLSPALATRYGGPGRIIVADCRHLPYASNSRDVLIVQGGLHHVSTLPSDLDAVLAEARRVLRSRGRLVVVEPWRTPFLSAVHFVSELRLARRLSGKLDAFATMTAHERTTYENWLGNPGVILASLERRFDTESKVVRWGKLLFVGRRRDEDSGSV